LPTKLYFHNATSAVAGTLPSNEQSTKTPHDVYEAASINRSMNTTIGTAQVTKSFNIAENVAAGGVDLYVTKFISEPLNQTGLSANTWTYNFACRSSDNTAVDDYPTGVTPSTAVPLCCYVWRPSTGAKVGNILDGDGSGFYDVGFDANNQTVEKSQHGSFTGSAVASTAVGDVIVFEAWVTISTDGVDPSTLSYYFDGTTETLADGTTVSNHASFIETPQNLAFVGNVIDMTQVSAKTYSNKFITKV